MFGKKAQKSPTNTPNPLEALQLTQPKTAAARRFMEFCLADFPTHAKADGFDASVYTDAVQLVINRLEAARHTE